MSAPPHLDRERVLAFRLAGQHLAQRLAPGSLAEAAGACGLQNSPPGSAELALFARVEGLAPETFERAVSADRTLLQIWSLRGAPYVVPARDAAPFTTGLLPQSEECLRAFIMGAEPALARLGLSGTEVVQRTAGAMQVVLDGRTLPFRQLSTELAAYIARDLPAAQLEAWGSPSGYAPGQPLGEALVHFALRLVALQGTLCFADRIGREAGLARTDQWLGAPLPGVATAAARAELVRRYLHCYGPSNPEHLAVWTGVSPAQALASWALVEPELAPVTWLGRTAWLLAADLPRLRDAPRPTGVRLLPPYDPYLSQRERDTLLPERRVHRRVWLRNGNPGAVLVDGEIAGLWRPCKQGRRLIVTIEPLVDIPAGVRTEVAAEASRLASFRGCVTAEAVFADAT
ncbi:MAG: winged helix DNA-binding domain-containing protein [Anaerolineae bacterium]